MQLVAQQEPHRRVRAVGAGQEGEGGAPRHEQIALAEIVVQAELLIVPQRPVVAGVGFHQAGTAHLGQPRHDLLLVADEVLPRIDRQAVVGITIGAARPHVDEQIQERLGEGARKSLSEWTTGAEDSLANWPRTRWMLLFQCFSIGT